MIAVAAVVSTVWAYVVASVVWRPVSVLLILNPPCGMCTMQDHDDTQKKSRVFKKFVFQGIELDKLMDMSHAEVVAMFRSNVRRRFKRGLSR